MPRISVILAVALCVAVVAGADGLRADWVERGWCWTPLTAREIPISDDHIMLASGEEAQVSLQLFLSKLRAADLTPGGTDVAPPPDPSGDRNYGQTRLGAGGARFVVEVGGAKRGSRLLLLADACAASAKPQDAALVLLAASRFLGRTETDTRGVLLESHAAVVALPARATAVGADRWVMRSDDGQPSLVCRLLTFAPDAKYPDIDRAQAAVETKMQALGYRPVGGSDIKPLDRPVRVRTFSKTVSGSENAGGDKAAERPAAVAYFSAGEWLHVMIVEGRDLRDVSACVNAVDGHSRLVDYVATTRDKSERRAARVAKGLLACADASGKVRLAFLDTAGSAFVWHGARVPAQVFDTHGQVLGEANVRDSRALSLAGAGIDVTGVPAKVRAVLPNGTSLECHVLRPPE